jgi:hypothetical protein
MFNSLDIDLYKDGYDINTMDCIDMPIAAAAGFYQPENYFRYLLLLSARNNWGDVVFDINANAKWDYFNIRNSILKYLGLTLKVHKTEERTEMLEIVKTCVMNNIPPLLIVKYKALFYYRYYMNSNGDIPHALIIDEWNSETSVLRIRDNAFLRDIQILDSKADIMFPLRLTEGMVADIWENSNMEFRQQKHLFTNSVYSIERNCNADDSTFETTIEELVNCDFSDSVLVRFIRNFNSKIDYIKSNTAIFRRNYYGCLNALFSGIERWIEKEGFITGSMENYYNFKDKYLKFRSITLAKLYKYADTDRKMTDYEIDNLAGKIKTYDMELGSLVNNLNNEYKLYKSRNSSKKNTVVQIDEYCNNEAFALSAEKGSSADITGNGVFFIAANLPHNGVININNIQLAMPVKTGNGQMDNISCKGQQIEIKEGVYSKIAFLGCSEYGSYREKIKLCRNQDIIEEAEINMSDFFDQPQYGEITVWKGQAAERNASGINLLNFNGRILFTETNISNTLINNIILPERKNIHLFAITLVE